MSFTFGDKIKISIFGQSHSEKMGVVIDSLPAGIKIDTERLDAFIKRRAPGRDEFSTPRRESDEIHFVSGLIGGVTCGAPLCAEIENKDAHRCDYEKLKDIPRPSHADYAAWTKFGDYRDVSGGGQFSGRLTAPICIAGGIIIQLLEKMGITVGAHIYSVGDITDDGFDMCKVARSDFVGDKPFPVINEKIGEKMKTAINDARQNGDSIGGSIECAVLGMPPGVGDAYFGGIESKISSAVFAIPAVKGVEFGLGFESSKLLGSQNNDAFTIENGIVKTLTNNHGGILGGISSGMPIIFRAAFKPTPSISKKQQSISLSKREETLFVIEGRHDPCIVRRAVVCVEAAAAIAVYDML